jgi:hypothetical protein
VEQDGPTDGVHDLVDVRPDDRPVGISDAKDDVAAGSAPGVRNAAAVDRDVDQIEIDRHALAGPRVPIRHRDLALDAMVRAVEDDGDSLDDAEATFLVEQDRCIERIDPERPPPGEADEADDERCDRSGSPDAHQNRTRGASRCSSPGSA